MNATHPQAKGRSKESAVQLTVEVCGEAEIGSGSRTHTCTPVIIGTCLPLNYCGILVLGLVVSALDLTRTIELLFIYYSSAIPLSNQRKHYFWLGHVDVRIFV